MYSSTSFKQNSHFKKYGKTQTNSEKTKSRAKGRRGTQGKIGLMEIPKMPG
jgi:hypothetical protein